MVDKSMDFLKYSLKKKDILQGKCFYKNLAICQPVHVMRYEAERYSKLAKTRIIIDIPEI